MMATDPFGDPQAQAVRHDPFAADGAGQHLVVLVTGSAKSGKSHFLTTAPRELAVVDTEAGLRHFVGRTSQFKTLTTSSLREILSAMDFLASEGRQHYACVGIDSFSPIWATLQGKTLKAIERRAEASGDEGSVEIPYQASRTDRLRLAELLIRIVHLGVHVILTAHREDMSNPDEPSIVPVTPHGLEYYVDVILRLELQDDGITRIGTIEGDRTGRLRLGQQFINPTFPMLVEAVQAKAASAQVVQAPDTARSTARPATPPAGRGAAQTAEPPQGTPAVTTPGASGGDDAPTIEELVAMAEGINISRTRVAATARSLYGKAGLDALTAEERWGLGVKLEGLGAVRLDAVPF